MSSEPEEMSMNEVLASIRQMLSDDVVEENEPLDNEIDDIFILTPAMRINQTPDIPIQEKMKLALSKLAEQKPKLSKEEYKTMVQQDFQPLLKEWMVEQMPTMIENAVEEQINKLLK